MLTNFYASTKTAPPACSFDCCGSKFGRIERGAFATVHGRVNRIKRARRWAKHAERQRIRQEIRAALQEALCI